MNGGGRRIKLDLSSFVHDGGSHRWMYLPDQSFSTVSYVVDRLKSEDSQLSEDDLVILMLEDFILPAWENINVLQSGDLVRVQAKSINKHQESTKESKKPSSRKSVPMSIPTVSNSPKLSSSKKSVNPSNKSGVKRSRKSSSSDDSSDSNEKDHVDKDQKKSNVTKRTKASESSSESSSDEDEKENQKKKNTIQSSNMDSKKRETSDSSSSSDSDSDDHETVPSKTANLNSQQAKLIKRVSSSGSDSDSESDSDVDNKSRNVTNPSIPVKPNVSKKVESSSDSSSSSDEESEEERKVETKVINVKAAALNSSASGIKPKRKRKRKNKNKNKLPLDQIPVFTAEIETAPGPVSVKNIDANNSHVRFGEHEDSMEVDSNDKQEFTEEDIKQLYVQSVASHTKTIVDNSKSINSYQKPNKSNDVSCEDVLIKQFDNKTVTNAGVVKKSSTLMFTPRVLSVNEMKVKSTRKKPLNFTNGHKPSNGVYQEEKKEDKTSAFAALLNCNGKVFDKNEEPVKDYTFGE